MLLTPVLQSVLQPALGLPNLSGLGGFSPAQLFAAGEQGGWYDPSDFSTQFQDSAGTTPVTAAGQPVGKVLDKSGRANHLAQATAASRTTLQQDASGFYYWSFDGADDSFATAAAMNLSGTDKVTVFAGLYKASDAAVAIALELTADTNSNAGGFYITAPNNAAQANLAFLARGSVIPGSGGLVTGWASPSGRVVTAAADIAGATQTVRTNGTAGMPSAASMGTGNFANATFYCGRRGGASFPLNGRLYQLIVRGAACSAAEVTTAERFVGRKMGISL